MNIALIYASKTGHSRKIAMAVATELGIQAMDIRTNPRLKGIDLLFAVGGIYGGKSAPELLEYVAAIENQQVKRAVLITSSASKSAKQSDLRAALTSKGIDVLEEEFKCKGAFLFIGLGHPNANDIEKAVVFAKRIPHKTGRV